MGIVRAMAVVLVVASAGLLTACSSGGKYDKPGFSTVTKDNTLYVFEADSEARAHFDKTGKMEKPVTMPTGGPDGLKVVAPNEKVLNAYLDG